MTTGIGDLDLAGLGSIGGLGGARKGSNSASGSRLSESFAEIFAHMLEKSRNSASVSTVDRTTEAQWLTERYMRLAGAFGPGGEYAGQSLDQLAEGLGDDFAALANEFANLCDTHGMKNAALVGGGGMFGVIHAIDPVAAGLMNTLTANGRFVDPQVQQNWENYLNDLDAAQGKAADFRSAFREKSGEWMRQMEILMARSILSTEGGRVKDLKEEFLASPEEVIKRYIGQIDSAVNQSIILYKDGRISKNF